jgi:hypothetical protein
VAGSCEYGDEPSGSGATELVLEKTLGGCKNRPGRGGEAKNSFLLSGIEPCLASPLPVSVMTTIVAYCS